MTKILWVQMMIAMAGWFAFATECSAGNITFGSGANSFQMEFVTIGNPGNGDNDFVVGTVGYEYNIGKSEVSERMIESFNASQSLQVTKDTRGLNKPATSISWNEAARFVNWLNTSTGGSIAYKFVSDGVNDNLVPWSPTDTLDFNALNPYRSKRATYVLPSLNEWYKAAYYAPIYSPLFPVGTYFMYSNGSNTPPIAVASGTEPNTAVFNQSFIQGPADVNMAGGLSYYGVMGLGGNVSEWLETPSSFATGASSRRIQTGRWFDSVPLSASVGNLGNPQDENYETGFRVASVSPQSPPVVPEPSMMVIGSILGLGGLIAKRRFQQPRGRAQT